MFAFGFGGQEIVLVALAAMLLFGAKKLPEMFRSMGQGISEFRKASQGTLPEPDSDKLPPQEAAEPQEGPKPE